MNRFTLFFFVLFVSLSSQANEDDYLSLGYEIINCETCTLEGSFKVAAKNAPLLEDGHIYNVRTIVVANLKTSAFFTFTVEFDREVNKTYVERTQDPQGIQQAIDEYTAFRNGLNSTLSWNYVPAWHAAGAGYSVSSTSVSPDAVFSSVVGGTPFIVTGDISGSVTTLINDETQQYLLHDRIRTTVVAPRIFLYARTAILSHLFKLKPVTLVLQFADGSKMEYDVITPFSTVPGVFVWDTAIDANGQPVHKAYETRGTATSSYGSGYYSRRPLNIRYNCKITYTGTIGVRMISQGRVCEYFGIDGDR